MHNDNLDKINEYLLPLSPFVFKVTPIRVASCISASNTSRIVPNLTKRKKKHSMKNNSAHKYSSLCKPNWRLRWKKGVRVFTQKWTLSKMLQISHAVLFTCAKQCSACFFPEVCIVFEILRMQKNPVFVVTSARDRKDGNFTSNPAKYWSFATCNLKKCWFQVKTVKILISR